MATAKKSILALLALAVLAAGLPACGDGTPGQKLDNALDKAGDKVKDAGDAIKPK
jgi:hypothetical protein